VIALLSHIQEKTGPLIGSLSLPFIELFNRISVGFEVLNECTDEFNKFKDILVLLCIDNLLEHLLRRSLIQDEVVLDQLFFKMI